MAEKEKYVIKVQGDLIEVSKEVYYAYFRMERQERWQEEKKKEHNVLSYDALDNGEMEGRASIPDLTCFTLEDLIMVRDLHDRLHNAISVLPIEERNLILAIYFDGKSERDYANQQGCSQNKVYKQRKKILSKLRLVLDTMGQC